MKQFLIVLLLLIVILAAVGFVLPQRYDVSRSVKIRAEPSDVHALVGDLKEWPRWAPWQEADPTVRVTLGDKTTGVGASQSWTGKDGNGRLSFTKSDPATGIEYDMVFINRGRESPAKSWMRYTPAAEGLEVTWGIAGEMDMPVVGGYMALFSDRMIGPMFEKGLNKLKVEAEKP